MGAFFKIPGMIVWGIGGTWGLIVCLGIIANKAGVILAILAFFLLPITITIAPWYVALAESNWFPVLLVYGSGVGGTILYQIGALIDGER